MRGLSDFEKYKILRPIIGGAEYDENEFPIIRKTVLDENEWTGIKAVNLQNARPSPMNQSSILLMFSYDSRLIALWNNPLKKVPLFQSYYAVASPDFSIYPVMNINDIRQNIYICPGGLAELGRITVVKYIQLLDGINLILMISVLALLKKAQ